MENEILRIFDGDMNCIGQKTRNEIHKKGYWHEVFHCWFTIMENDECYVLLQKRAAVKKEYPGYFDITTAGHLLADERIEDGVREVEEELGVSIEFKDLIFLGIIKGEVKLGSIWDREICHVFLYKCEQLPVFQLHKDEVDSIYKVRLDDVINLFNNIVSEIEATEINDCDHKQEISQRNFVGQESDFLQVFEWIKGILC